MGLLTSLRDERLIFVGLGLATVSFVGMMRLILTHYRDEAEIRPKSPKTQYITQATEDALDLQTISSLLDHYNPTIRDTATKIVVGRAVNDGDTIRHLLRGIMQASYDVREKYLRALTFAMEDRDTNQDQLKPLNTPDGYRAIVRSLEHSLNDRARNNINDLLWDEYQLRDVNERRCIMLIQQLLHRYTSSVKFLMDANFVERWLIKQGWGDTDEDKHTNFTNYIHRRKNRLSDICAQLLRTKDGRKALRQSKLIHGRGRGSPYDGSDNGGIKVILEISMQNEDENGEIHQESFQAELVPRNLIQSDEEQRRRRRHREAIVLNDGTHSLGRGDIIEREHESEAS
ncbi:hypothetical protein BKA67DRAFT_584252 [Truncatella angustata]|uniref:Cytoskeleton-associated protein n=1 Tax=Truncatella angustata TaxID=152316 RepID=A0A9P8RN07_9PEZI|nr:uncharacterized protein BKA67DRAFT_584252 [Truncatella angustata]KAH6646425.1 hypothetical protein BKA67DRAFT_584252 [Truncatella angustata]KAH8200728.1 hypothetical protein TruAng_005117 [Truncatella angustata]